MPLLQPSWTLALRNLSLTVTFIPGCLGHGAFLTATETLVRDRLRKGGRLLSDASEHTLFCLKPL